MSLTGWTSKDPQPHIKEFPSIEKMYEFLRKAKIDASLEIPQTLIAQGNTYVFNSLTREYEKINSKTFTTDFTLSLLNITEGNYVIKHELGTLEPAVLLWVGNSNEEGVYNNIYVPPYTIQDANTILIPESISSEYNNNNYAKIIVY